ncbi:hypothetical protein [Pelagibacterium luteolum]|uniref:YCII-related domain-containing protein n=1 Tax=Pelagibacterium luteolum TaxID=440168 RepID=A0A1G7WV12_9HYPH|nr:hypothetical protein [Pelagibacterium luteolum]SDG75759.1 hypothetical protein SAMN04487974_107135 [Pelagibacterium luteolum]
MPKFLAIYTGTASASEKAQAEGRVDEAAGMKAWGDWMMKNDKYILDAGGPLGRTLKVSPAGITETTNTAAAYIIVDAPTLEDAAEMFRDHAHFTHFPGEAVEVMPILDMPGM